MSKVFKFGGSKNICFFLPPLNLLILNNRVTVVQVLIAGYFSTGHFLYLQQTYAKPSFEISLLFFSVVIMPR